MLISTPDNQFKFKSFLIDEYTKFKNIGFFLSNTGVAQKSFTLLHEINKFLSNTPYTDINLFVMQKEIPVVLPLCGIFSPNDITYFHGPLFVSDLLTLQIALNKAYRAKIYYYIYDINEIKQLDKAVVKILLDINKKIDFIVQTNAHRDYMNSLGFKVMDHFMPDWSIETIQKILA